MSNKLDGHYISVFSDVCNLKSTGSDFWYSFKW